MKNAVLAVLAATIVGCSHTVVVRVAPRVELQPYGTLGIMNFSSNGERTLGVQATLQFQEQLQEAQPGTRFLELGSRDAVLAGIGARDFDPESLRRIGEKYRVNAVVPGEIVYAEPRTGRPDELRADISGRLIETRTGASVWTRSAWTRREIGMLGVSAQPGASGAAKFNAREEMLPSLVYPLTHDFRPGTRRETAP